MKPSKGVLISILIGVPLLAVAALLSLALDQAILLVLLYRVLAAPAAGLDSPARLGLGEDLFILAGVSLVLFLAVCRHPRRVLPVSGLAPRLFFGPRILCGWDIE
jgi:hypothetical protein